MSRCVAARTIGLSALAAPHLPQVKAGAFVFGGKRPLSYTQVRRMCSCIKRDTGFAENITPIRFRTTVLTDLYDQAKDIKLAQAASGHTTSAMTLRYYIKGREAISKAAAVLDRAHSAQVPGSCKKFANPETWKALRRNGLKPLGPLKNCKAFCKKPIFQQRGRLRSSSRPKKLHKQRKNRQNPKI